jgi:hypothetical protein
MRDLRGHFHVTTGANFVFERDYSSIAFAVEKTLETAEHIFINLPGQLGAFLGQSFQSRLQNF